MEDPKSFDNLSGQKIFIGGLSPHTTQDSLYSHFFAFGSIKDCILMLDKTSGRSRCFGFVTMEDSALIDLILSHDQIIDGKKADCNIAVPNQNSFRTKKVFVGGLPLDITDELFREFFEQFGSLEDSVVMLDRDTGRPRGFGFITFFDEDSTEKVLENYEKNCINGKWIDCKKAVPKIGNVPTSYNPNLMFEHYSAKEFIPMNFYPMGEDIEEKTESQ